MRNYGQHNALLCGVRAARFDTVVTIDDDLQHPPEEIPKLLSKLSEGYDVVYGMPIKQKHSLWRNLASYFTRLALQGTMGIENARKVSARQSLSHPDTRGLYQLSKSICDLGCTACLGYDELRIDTHSPRNSSKRSLELYFQETHASRHKYDDWFYRDTVAICQHGGFRICFVRYAGAILRHRALPDPEGQRPRISFPGVDHSHLLRRAAVCAWNYGRISGTNPLPDHGKTNVYHPRRDQSRDQRTIEMRISCA